MCMNYFFERVEKEARWEFQCLQFLKWPLDNCFKNRSVPLENVQLYSRNNNNKLRKTFKYSIIFATHGIRRHFNLLKSHRLTESILDRLAC